MRHRDGPACPPWAGARAGACTYRARVLNASNSHPEEGRNNASYLDEIYFDVPGKDGFKNLHDLIGSALKDGLPPSVTLKARPFISNEEAKVILVLDIPDHSTTFGVFSGVVGKGLAAKRRLTPVVDWAHFDKTMKDRK
jgi:hypothetical protein